jgi:hypothetical protein
MPIDENKQRQYKNEEGKHAKMFAKRRQREEKYLKMIMKRQRTDRIGWQSLQLYLGILLKMETTSELVS